MKSSLPKISFFILLALILSACGTINIQTNNSPTAAVINAPEDEQAQTAGDNSASSPSYKLPKTILVDTDDGYGLTFFSLQGQPITELKTLGIGYGSSKYVHIAGTIPEGPIMTPLVFHSFENPESLLVNINDSISTLVKTPMFYGMVGAPGEAYIAYSVYNPVDNLVHSDLYMGDLETLPTNGPIYSFDNDTDFSVINPVGIQTDAGVAIKVWFTFSAWGIGGDIIYPVNNSLYSLDMTTGDVVQHLDKNCSLQGLSQDFTWAACRTGDGNGNYGYFTQNLVNGGMFSFQVDPSNNRGAGYGAFSPDDLYVAWIEASGTHMAETPNYHSHLRVGLTGGGIVYDQADINLAAALGVGSISFMKPVGWIDTQTLLVEISVDNSANSFLITVNISNGSVSQLISGSFIAFAYL